MFLYIKGQHDLAFFFTSDRFSCMVSVVVLFLHCLVCFQDREAERVAQNFQQDRWRKTKSGKIQRLVIRLGLPSMIRYIRKSGVLKLKKDPKLSKLVLRIMLLCFIDVSFNMLFKCQFNYLFLRKR
jgi:hypothetical protein